MTRLPTVAADGGAWGTVLNDYLTENAVHTTLANSPSVGATTFDVAVIPPGLAVGSIVLIDAYTTEAEMKAVTAISSNTVTVSATKYAHTSGDMLLVLRNFEVSPVMYGMTSSAADNWGPFQRMVMQANDNNVTCRYAAALKGAVWSVSRPILAHSGTIWRDIGLKTHGSYGPADDAGALCMVSNREWAFTATASDDTFTVAGGHGMGGSGSYSEVNHTKIVFNNPYGETLPGGITAGQVYYIKTTPTTSTFTVSATPGGTTLDVTADGAGYGWESIQQLARTYWDNVRLDVNVANVNGLLVSMQQPSYIQNLRVEMSANATVRAYGVILTGQIGALTNIEINPIANNLTGLQLAGTGMTIANLNMVGNNTDTCYGVEVACWAGTITNLWTESLGIGVKITGECRGFAVDGTWLMSSGAPNPIALQVDTGGAAKQSSYRICPIKWGTGGNRVFYDIDRSISLYTSGYATNPALIVTDFQGTYMGHVQEGQNVSDLGYKPPVLAYRSMVDGTGSYPLRYADKGIMMSTAGGDRTITLPTAVGWIGHEFTIHHKTGSANVCTIACTAAETIDGSATTTVASGSSKRVMSDGANWVSV